MSMKKTALITGVTGQDGSYLAEFLLSKGYDVHGTIRRSSVDFRERIAHLEGKELSSYEADVDTDADYTPDHEVITDGYFAESGADFRSTPFFNVQIDGITLLDVAY